MTRRRTAEKIIVEIKERLEKYEALHSTLRMHSNTWFSVRGIVQELTNLRDWAEEREDYDEGDDATDG